MVTARTEYLVDEKGRKKAVLLDIKQYTRLIDRLEELEDALDLDEAIRNGKEFRNYSVIREELLREKRL
jgi:hypothetical protein